MTPSVPSHATWARSLRSLGWAALLLGWWDGALGLDPALDIAQYGHTAWRIREGFAGGHQVALIAQTTDGYLWLGGQSGLFRFDGARAIAWQPPEGQALPDRRIASLLGARDGTLWIGTWSGLASWKAGRLTTYPQIPAQFVVAMVEDHDGVVWAGSASVDPGLPTMLCKVRNGQGSCERLAAAIGQITSLCEDGAQRMWAITTTGLWSLQPGAVAHRKLQEAIFQGLQGLAEDRDGALLISTRHGITRLADGSESAYATLPEGLASAGLTLDRDGSVWIRSLIGGLFHAHKGRLDAFGKVDGLSGEPALSFIEDREGTFWVTTEEGLDRFRNLVIPTVSVRQGLLSANPGSILQSTDGSVWISVPPGLNRWHEGEMTAYLADGEQSATLPGITGSSSVRRIRVSGLPPSQGSLFEDTSGRLWFATLQSTGFVKDGRYTRMEGISGGFVDAIAEDTAGNLWFAHRSLGLLRVSPELQVERILWTRLGDYGAASSLAPDPKNGGLWLGFLTGGIVHLVDDKVGWTYSAANGLAPGLVHYLRADPDGVVWIGAEGGLSRLKNGRIVTLDRRRGLPCDSIDWMVEDDLGGVWVYTACGIARIDRSELDNWAAMADRGVDATVKIRVTVFDSSDGVLSVGDVTTFHPHVAKSLDGRLWFVTRGGVGVLDPRHLPRNSLPPPVRIEGIVADRKVYEAERPHLPPLVRDLEIDYTALSLAVPEKVGFRYQLEGHDRGWQDAGNRRQAFYNDLAPGNYLFRVIASNESGVWNEQGAALSFTIAPAYWQTNWFRALCALAVLGILWGGYQLRVRQLTRAFDMTLDARVSERIRIARELHDTLLQSFQGLLLRLQTVAQLLPARAEDAKEIAMGTVDQAAQAIRDGRNAIQGLRTSAVESADLAVELRTLGELAAAESRKDAVEFHVEVEGTPRTLKPIVRDEIYRIAGEALRNAFRHAEPTEIEVELRYDAGQLRLRVRDDGKGVDPRVLDEGTSAGHHGLRGMRERAGLIGGAVTVWSALSSGTEVELIVPASTAYAKARSTRRSWLAERIARRRAEI